MEVVCGRSGRKKVRSTWRRRDSFVPVWTVTARRPGYDLELTRTIAENVSIPVIASGGAGNLEHFYEALGEEGKADAALAASLFHYKELEIREVKEYLREKGVSVRL